MNDHDMPEFIHIKILTLGKREGVLTRKIGEIKKNKQKVKQTLNVIRMLEVCNISQAQLKVRSCKKKKVNNK